MKVRCLLLGRMQFKVCCCSFGKVHVWVRVKVLIWLLREWKKSNVWAWGFGRNCCFKFVWLNLLNLGCKNSSNKIKNLQGIRGGRLEMFSYDQDLNFSGLVFITFLAFIVCSWIKVYLILKSKRECLGKCL